MRLQRNELNLKLNSLGQSWLILVCVTFFILGKIIKYLNAVNGNWFEQIENLIAYQHEMKISNCYKSSKKYCPFKQLQ